MLNDTSRILNDTWMVSVCLNIEGFYFFAGRKWLTIRVGWSGRYEVALGAFTITNLKGTMAHVQCRKKLSAITVETKEPNLLPV